MNYSAFLESKRQIGCDHGFDPMWLHPMLFFFQKDIVTWALRKGRAAIFADCGLGKTPMQLVWAENVVRKTNGRVLILTPLAVSFQTEREAEKFEIAARVSRDGSLGKPKIVITNYERLHHFSASDFQGVVCDESSILKNFDGATRTAVTDFMRHIPYRLLCTATAAPNDYIELGTSSEALGELGFMDMISRFFKKVGSTCSRKDEYRRGTWRFRGHAEHDFWRWVCSWARALRKPSDMGYDDGPFVLPELALRDHVVKATTQREGWLFDMPAIGLAEQRAERRRTLTERCEKAASLVDHSEAAICWCHLNSEGDLLERMIPDGVQVAGKDTDDRKEEVFKSFAAGEIRVLVTKPSIAGFGLNWQHCAHQTFFPSHSFEQWYQAVRRSWRFGQTHPVIVDVITSEGERDVLLNLRRKQDAAEAMFASLIDRMHQPQTVVASAYGDTMEEIPQWL